MLKRELARSEWVRYFDAFSRDYQGHRATLDLPEPHTMGTVEEIARDMPFGGITIEPRGTEEMGSIEITLGTAPPDHLIHTINHPTHIFIEVDEHGEDEKIVIQSLRDPTVRLDFSEASPKEQAARAPRGAARA